ncbi:glycosyl transferase family 2 [Burkholderia sp. MR1]|nr:glycosyl transferase family 2 [Burkholderia sp. MR1]
MSHQTPRVSIIVTSYNYARFIGEAIDSVLAQTFESWELIIVDDCSSDDSWEVISRYKDDRIHAIRLEQNLGACACYNTAFGLARGEFIASLDSDDAFADTKLAEQVAFFDDNPDATVCGTYLEEVDDASERVGSENLLYAPWFNKEWDLNDPATWVWENHLCHSSTLVRKSLHDHVGLFRPDLTYTPDWNFWIRALVGGAKFHVLPRALTRYRSHGNNITHRDPSAVTWEYADFAAGVFHPYLENIGREDLIEKSDKTTLSRFFALEGDWLGFLKLVELLKPVVKDTDRYRINPSVFDDPELTQLLIRLALHGGIGAEGNTTLAISRRLSEDALAAVVRIEKRAELSDNLYRALTEASRTILAKLDRSNAELERSNAELQDIKAALQDRELSIRTLIAENNTLRSEVHRLQNSVGGRVASVINKIFR